jgi:hypothetical protein
MKALKIIATVVLAALLFCAMLTAEAIALVRFTVLEPEFYGRDGRQAYLVISDAVVGKMADAVLERAPSIVLKTGNRQEARRLAFKALPPENVAKMLEESGPEIARYIFYGGNLPVLAGSKEFAQGMNDVVSNLLMDGVWELLPDKPNFPAFMPFTPEWNLSYGKGLEDALWPVRHYAGLADYALWLALAAITLFLGLIYLLWIRQRKGFYATLAAMLALNGLLVATGAICASFLSTDLASEAARYYPVSLAAGLFGQSWTTLFKAVLMPFRDILFWAAFATLSLAVAAATTGIERVWQPWPWKALPPQNPALPAQKQRNRNVTKPDTVRNSSRVTRRGSRRKGPRHAGKPTARKPHTDGLFSERPTP